MRTLLALASLLLLVSAVNIDITLTGNVSNPTGHPSWSFRSTTLTVLPLLKTFAVTSASLQPGSIDTVTCAAGFGSVPWVLLSQAMVNTSGVSAAEIGMALLRLLEVDSSGVVVKTTLMSDLTFSVYSSNTAGTVKSLTISASLSGGGTVYFTFLASDVVGIIAYGSAVVSPKSLEVVVEIDNYTYANSNNKLELIFASASLSASVSSGALVSTVAGTDVYITMNGKAQVNGQSVNVQFATVAQENINTLGISDIAKVNFNAYVQTVSFPAGAASIIWDPAVGSGSPAYGGGGGSFGSASAISASISLIILSLLAYLIF